MVDEGVYFDVIYNVDAAGDWAPDFDMLIWWTGGTPDPGIPSRHGDQRQHRLLGRHLLGERGLRRLWYEQATTIDREARKAIVWEAQKLVYDESPFIPLAYPRVLQAYRADDWTGWVRSPAAAA